MLIAQLSDLHLVAGRTLSGGIDTTALLQACVRDLCQRRPAPDVLLLSGDLSDAGGSADYALLRELLAPLLAQQPLALLPMVGNHDERGALRAALGDWLQPCSALHPHWLQYAYERSGLRLLVLDSVVAGQPHGELCPERLHWLAQQLQASPAPALVALHHPPYTSGMTEMDGMGLRRGSAELEALLRLHPQVQAVCCGHLHRISATRFAHTLALSAPSTAHQIALELEPQARARYIMEPPGYLLHRWSGVRLLTHSVVVGDFGPARDFGD